jgi:thymidylate kinase
VPIERSCVSAAAPDGAFKVPIPEHELVLLALKLVLGRSALAILAGRDAAGHATARLTELLLLTSRARVRDVLERDLPGLDAKLFELAVESCRSGATRAKRLEASLRVPRVMRAYARRPLLADLCLRLGRGASSRLRRHVLRCSEKRQLAGGGGIIAIVGGDGAGKSTVVEGLSAWLSRDLETSSVHMGKPRWSWLTTTIRAIVKIGQLMGLYPPESSFRETLEQRSFATTGPWLLREICRARDRYAKYVAARRSAGAGALVISDRFPLPQIRLMDGPLAQRLLDALDAAGEVGRLSLRRGSAVARAVVKMEESYYRRYTAPEVLIVLRVDPEIAAERRAGEDVVAVRERSTEIWHVDWQHTRAHVIDAGRPKAEVLALAKAVVWSEL